MLPYAIVLLIGYLTSAIGQELLSNAACNEYPDRGTCEDSFDVKWYYDRFDHRCRRFFYGGCGGNANRFESEQECSSQCQFEAKKENDKNHLCFQPHDPGQCQGDFERWHFDADQGRCVCSWWSGCGGNSNRFYSYAHCMSVCGEFAQSAVEYAISRMFQKDQSTTRRSAIEVANMIRPEQFHRINQRHQSPSPQHAANGNRQDERYRLHQVRMRERHRPTIVLGPPRQQQQNPNANYITYQVHDRTQPVPLVTLPPTTTSTTTTTTTTTARPPTTTTTLFAFQHHNVQWQPRPTADWHNIPNSLQAQRQNYETAKSAERIPHHETGGVSAQQVVEADRRLHYQNHVIAENNWNEDDDAESTVHESKEHANHHVITWNPIKTRPTAVHFTFPDPTLATRPLTTTARPTMRPPVAPTFAPTRQRAHRVEDNDDPFTVKDVFNDDDDDPHDSMTFFKPNPERSNGRMRKKQL